MQTFKCSYCGTDVPFDPAASVTVCPGCGVTLPPPEREGAGTAPVQEAPAQKLYLKISDKNEEKLSRVQALSRIFPGTVPLILYDARTGKTRRAAQGIDAQDLVLSELAWILGEDAVVLK